MFASAQTDIELTLDGRRYRFEVITSLKPSILELETIVRSAKGQRLLLVTTKLSPRMLDFCRKSRLNAIDLNGRVYLRDKGLLVDRQALTGRNFRHEHQPRNIFVGKSARIIRALLTDRDLGIALGASRANTELCGRTSRRKAFT